MMIKHLQTMKKVKHMISEESKHLLAFHKLENILQNRQRRQKIQQFHKFLDNLTFPQAETENVKMYQQILLEENVSPKYFK